MILIITHNVICIYAYINIANALCCNTCENLIYLAGV